MGSHPGELFLETVSKIRVFVEIVRSLSKGYGGVQKWDRVYWFNDVTGTGVSRWNILMREVHSLLRSSKLGGNPPLNWSHHGAHNSYNHSEVTNTSMRGLVVGLANILE